MGYTVGITSLHFLLPLVLSLFLPPFFPPLYTFFFQVRTLAQTDLELLLLLPLPPKFWYYKCIPSYLVKAEWGGKTHDLVHAKQELYQLNYSPSSFFWGGAESYIAQASLEPMIFLLHFPKSWDYTHEPSRLAK